MKLPPQLDTSLPADVAEINTPSGKNFQVYVQLIQINHTILKYISKKLTFSLSKTTLSHCLLPSIFLVSRSGLFVHCLTVWVPLVGMAHLWSTGMGLGAGLGLADLPPTWLHAQAWQAGDNQLRCSLRGFSLQLLGFLHSRVRYKKKKTEVSSPLKGWVWK